MNFQNFGIIISTYFQFETIFDAGSREIRNGCHIKRSTSGGRDDCYTYSNIGMFNSNTMAPQYLNNNHVTYYVISINVSRRSIVPHRLHAEQWYLITFDVTWTS